MKELLMNSDTIMLIISIITFVIGRYVVPKIPPSTYEFLSNALDEIEFVVKWADKYVLWARQFMSANSGVEKMNYVVNAITTICDQYCIDMDDEQIQAIVQESYDNLIAGKKEAEKVENK